MPTALQMTPSDVDAAVRTTIGEASPDPQEQQAVAAVIRNRAINSGTSLTDVVHAPGQFESWKAHGGYLSSINPSSPTYQTVLARIAPVLSGQQLGDFHADSFYAPKAQAALGRPAPSWDNGTGTDIGATRFLKAGGHYGLGGAQHGSAAPMAASIPAPSSDDEGDDSAPPIPVAPAPPTPQEFAQRNGLTPTAAPQPPSPEEFARRNGLPSPSQSVAPAPISASMQRALADAKAQQGNVTLPERAIEPFANSFLVGSVPMMAGAINATTTAANNALSKVGITQGAGYSPEEAYDATRQVVQRGIAGIQARHPVISAAENIAPFLIDGPVKATGTAIERGLGGVAAKVIPKVAATPAGRLGARVASASVLGGIYGTNQGLSEGQDVPTALTQGAESAALTAPLALAGEGALGAASHLKVPAPKLILPVTGAAAGAALGTVAPKSLGLTPATGAMAGLGIGLGARGKGEPVVEPTPVERNTALDMVAKAGGGYEATADTLEAAHPTQLIPEPLGQKGADLVKAASPVAGGPLHDAIDERQAPSAVLDRVASGISDATGIHPEVAPVDLQQKVQDEQAALAQTKAQTLPRLVGSVQDATGIDPASAQMSVRDQIEAARAGPVRDAYEAALPGKPVWNPELAALSKEPEVRSAMYDAKRMLGSEAMVDNPAAKIASDGRKVISAADYQNWLKTGDDSFLRNGGQPAQVPTDRMWDLVKQNLDRSVTYNALGRPESSTQNAFAQKWSSAVRNATNKAIPGLQEARAVAGEQLSSQRAYDNGTDLWSAAKKAETLASLNRRWSALTPAEQAATQKGYLAEAYRRMENGKFNPDEAQSPFHKGAQQTMFGPAAKGLQATFAQESALAKTTKGPIETATTVGTNVWAKPPTPAVFDKFYSKLSEPEKEAVQHAYLAELYRRFAAGRLTAKAIAESPFHQAALKIMFGPRAAQIMESLKREQGLAISGKAIKDAVKHGPEPEKEHGGAAFGMTMAAAEHGLHPAALARGAIAGGMGKTVGTVVKAIKAGKTTPGVRAALGEILAQTPQITAKQLRLRNSAQQQAKLSQSPLKARLAQSALRGLAVAGGVAGAHALSGLGGNQ